MSDNTTSALNYFSFKEKTSLDNAGTEGKEKQSIFNSLIPLAHTYDVKNGSAKLQLFIQLHQQVKRLISLCLISCLVFRDGAAYQCIK